MCSLDARGEGPTNEAAPLKEKRASLEGILVFCSTCAVKDSLAEGNADEKYLPWVDG